MPSTKSLLLAISLSLIATNASAGTVKRKIFGLGAIAGGVALYQSAKKNCHSEKDPETGRVLWICNKQPAIDDGDITDKSSSTYELRKALNEERVSAGLPPDPEDCDAHHIVPKGENREWALESVTQARGALEGCVDLDSALNGVYLPGKKNGAPGCEGSYHRGLHTRDYYLDLGIRLPDAYLTEGCDGVQRELIKIKNELMSGGKW